MNRKVLFIFLSLLLWNLNNPTKCQEMPISKPTIYIYPSSSEKEICVEFSETINVIEFKIINVVGDIVYKNSTEQISIKKFYINISFLQSGIYFLVITTNKAIYTSKFVKK